MNTIIKVFENILETLICITAILSVPLTVCFGIYFTRNPWCLIGLALCYGYKIKGNKKDKTNHDKDDKQKVEEE